MVAGGKKCSTRSTITPTKHALQIFTDTSKEGWDTHLNEHTARGTWSLSESKLHINHLELKAVFRALNELQDLCSNNIVLVATDNTTVVVYINKEGGMKSGCLCGLLWRILTWCTRRQVTFKARHIPGRLNMIADKLSRLGQTTRTEWSLHPEVFQAMFSRWHQPQVDLFTTRFNNRLPHFVSPVPDPQAWAVVLGEPGSICLPTGIVVVKLQDYPCNRIILIALVLGSSGHVQSDPTVPTNPAKSSNSAIQPDLTQESVKLEPSCRAPRATAIKEQGFSEAVAARFETPQRESTRSIYQAKWTIFTKWYIRDKP